MTTYSGNCTDCVEMVASGAVDTFLHRVKRWSKMQALKLSVARERQHLLEMSDSMLNDVGLTRDQAYAESKRVDIPENRLKTLV